MCRSFAFVNLRIFENNCNTLGTITVLLLGVLRLLGPISIAILFYPALMSALKKKTLLNMLQQ